MRFRIVRSILLCFTSFVLGCPRTKMYNQPQAEVSSMRSLWLVASGFKSFCRNFALAQNIFYLRLALKICFVWEISIETTHVRWCINRFMFWYDNCFLFRIYICQGRLCMTAFVRQHWSTVGPLGQTRKTLMLWSSILLFCWVRLQV